MVSLALKTKLNRSINYLKVETFGLQNLNYETITKNLADFCLICHIEFFSVA